VDVLIEGGGLVDGPDAWIDIRQPAEATNGTTVRTAGDRLIINDPGSICTQGVDAGPSHGPPPRRSTCAASS
jgi:hypothetical protein